MEFAVFIAPTIRLFLLCFLASHPEMLSLSRETEALDFNRDVQRIPRNGCRLRISRNKPLKQEQIDILKQWIAEGAKYERHLAFVAPAKRAVPEVGGWGHNKIDRFVLARMAAVELHPKQAETAASQEKIILTIQSTTEGGGTVFTK